jgi:pimeloyl-ACP methyl ester carboxylesterase
MKITLMVCFFFFSIFARAEDYRSFTVKTPDGLRLSAQEWGNPNGPELLFVHGLGQSHLSWERQYHSELAKQFRIVTYDLRGHGDSDKPVTAEMYSEGKRWGDDLNAVMLTAGLKKPTVIAWSLGGAIVENYLRTYGETHIAAVVFVDAVVVWNANLLPAGPLLPALGSPDLSTRTRGIVDFLRACFYTQPSESEFSAMLTYNGMVPAIAQVAIQHLSLPDSESTLGRLTRPVLIIQGEQDRLVSGKMADYASKMTHHAKLDVIPDSGHAPFYEKPERFNEDLKNFVHSYDPLKRAASLGMGTHKRCSRQ